MLIMEASWITGILSRMILEYVKTKIEESFDLLLRQWKLFYTTRHCLLRPCLCRSVPEALNPKPSVALVYAERRKGVPSIQSIQSSKQERREKQ